jgi:TP901 family phage tail tape measure protein
MAAPLGTAVLELTTDNSKLDKGLDQGEASAKGFGKAASVAVAGVGLALVGVGAGFGAAVSAAAGFEQTMSGVKAVSGASAEELAQLSGLALQLGNDTSFSASEAALGLEELVKGGVAIPDIMNGAAQATLNLAAAGGVSLPDAAEIAANAMAMFSLKGSDMAMVADQIAGAANASSLSVGDFKMSLGAVGAVANLAGQSFQDTATAIALMGAAGIKGSDAGTSLKTMLMNLTPTTDRQAGAMQKLGLLTADGANKFLDAQGNFKSLRDISGELSKALEGLSESEKTMALEAIFGSDAIRAGAVLTKAGAEGFDTMAASMNKVTAAGVAAERLNNFNGSLEQLKGSVETAAITLGLAFLPMLKSAADALTGLVNAAIPLIETYGPQLVVMLQTAGGAMKAAWDAVQPLREALAQLFGGDTTGGLEALGAAARDAMGTLQGAFASAVQWLADQVPALVETLTVWGRKIIEWVAPMIPPLLEELGKLYAAALAWIVEQIPGWIDTLGKWGMEFIAWIAPLIPPMLTELGKLLNELLDWAGANAPAILEKFIGDWVPAILGFVAVAAIELGKALPGIMLAIWQWQLSAIPKMVELAKGLGVALVDGMLHGFHTAVDPMFDSIMAAVRGGVNGVIAMINRAIDSINGIVISVPSVDIPLVGLVGGFSVGMPQIPHIPSLAMGGDILARGLALVGDAGPELLSLPRGAQVSPLSRGGGPTIIIQGPIYGYDDFRRKVAGAVRDTALGGGFYGVPGLGGT